MAWALTASATQANSAANPVVMAFDCAGADLLVVCVNTRLANRAGGVPTYNGDSMTDCGKGIIGGSEGRVELFYLVNPDAGSNNISIPNTGTNQLIPIASAWTGVDTTDVIDVTASNFGDPSANPSCQITTSASGKLIVDAMMDGLATVPTANSHTLIASQVHSAGSTANSQYTTDDGSSGVTLTWTVASDDWAMIVAAFNPAASGTTYYETITCGLALTPTITRVVTFKRTISTGLSLTASISRLVTFRRSISCGLALTPTITRVCTFFRSIACGLTLTPTISRIVTFKRSITTGLSLTAAISRIVTFRRTIATTLSLTPTITAITGYIPVLYHAVISCGLRLTPTITRVVTFRRSITTNLALTPAFSVKLFLSRLYCRTIGTSRIAGRSVSPSSGEKTVTVSIPTKTVTGDFTCQT